jgi:hypothetical protein
MLGERTDPPSVPVTQIAHYYFTGVSYMSNDITYCLLKNSVLPKEHIIERYLKFINYCKNIEFDCYTETHHIIPRSFNGTNDNSNLIKLSARHHYIAHLLLARATNSPKMIKALHKMIYSTTGDVQRDYKITSRVYAYVREEHAKVVSNYSKNTVVAKHLYTNKIKRIPKSVFDEYNGIMYQALAKGREDSPETKIKKLEASKRPRIVKQKTITRSIAASKYSYQTPKGFCQTSKELTKLYPTFTKNTLTIIDNDVIISNKFASIHTEFLPYVGYSFKEYGIIKLKKESNVKN